MRIWAYALLTMALTAAVGCGGGGSSVPNGGGGGGGGGGIVLDSVNLPNTPGLLNVQYLSGAGRLAPTGQSAEINDLSLQDVDGFVADQPLANSITIQLDGYSQNFATLNVPVDRGTNSRLFAQFTLNIYDLVDSGVHYAGPNGSPAVYQNFDANIRMETGRQVSIPIYLDNTTLYMDFDPITYQPVIHFDIDRFKLLNYDQTAQKILGLFADNVMFDLSGMPSGSRPVFGTTAAVSNKVFFTGDNISLGDGAGNFETILPTQYVDGIFTDPVQIGSTVAPGSYTLLQPNPSTPTTEPKIASLSGIWRSYTDVIANPQTFEAIVFPNANGSAQQDIVMFSRDAGTGAITNFYYGKVDYTTSTFSIYPIANVTTASTTGEVQGSLTSFTDASGNAVASPSTSWEDVRAGTWSFSGTPPSGFPSNGRFLAFRR